VRVFVLLFICFNSAVRLQAQTDDSAVYTSTYDSTTDESFTTEEDVFTSVDQDAPSDSTVIAERKFSSSRLKELQSDDDLHYQEPPSVGSSLWDRFLQWLNELIISAFDKTFNTNWGNTPRILLVLL
jgi:hypothetical protein